MQTATVDTGAAPRHAEDAGDQAAPHQHADEAVGPFLMPLRDHQKRAVTAAWRAVRDGGRAIIESCCGSGKTLIAAACARRVAARGSVLATMPTIELVWQTAGVWLKHGGRRGPVVIVCSSSENRELEEAGLKVDAVITTKAHKIAEVVRAAAGGPVTVFATYASIDRVVEAHALHAMPGFDLAIIDEAHRTAGSSAKPWAAVHDDTKIPSRRRLYFTATPRIAGSITGGLEDSTGGAHNVICSMDDPEVFGETVFRYPVAQGIADGLIADYEVIVPVITDQDLQELLNEPGISDLRSRRTNEELQRLALQIATCRAIETYQLERVITYHSRIRGARDFVHTLHHAAQLLPPSDRLTHLYRAAVAGSDRLKDRRRAFKEFATESANGGHRCALIANSRLLAEGIDLPAVDAVIFADPKNSIVDIVQGAGRAFRVPLGVTGKVARIIIPVYLPAVADETTEENSTETELNRSAFAAVWQVLRALAAHDERVTARIIELRTNRYGAEQLRPHTAEPGLEEGEDTDELEDALPAEDVEWLRVETTAYEDQILRTLKLRALSPRTAEWEKWHERAEAFYQQHGHLDIREGDLVDWLNRQREAHAAARLDAARISELDRIGMIWDKHAHAWARGYAYAKAWHTIHGDLAIPASTKIDGYTVGRWMRVQRLNPNLTEEQRQLLDALDPLWRWDPKWQRGLRRMAAYLKAGGTLTGPRNRPGLGDDPTFRPGAWQHQQIQQTGGLHSDQIALLDGFGDWRNA